MRSRYQSILRNGVDLIIFGIPPISAKNAGMDGARKSIAIGKMLYRNCGPVNPVPGWVAEVFTGSSLRRSR
jgi:hypothetical protein